MCSKLCRITEHKNYDGKTVYLWLVLSLSFALRLWLSTLGNNWDLDSYWIVSELFGEGLAPYGFTDRYNYGPVWFVVLGILRKFLQIIGSDNISSLHALVAALVSLADCGMALYLFRTVGLSASVFFALNPISLLISGYHSQFDAIPISIGILSCVLVSRSRAGRYHDCVLGAVLLGFSLATKHILIFFPFWLWACLQNAPRKFRLTVLFVPYIVFGVTLLPFLIDPSSMKGVLQNVFAYRSRSGSGLTALAIEFCLQWAHVGVANLQQISFLVFTISMLGVGLYPALRATREISPMEAYYCYLICLVAFSVAMADQYLAIPLVALSATIHRPILLAYLALGAFLLLSSQDNVLGISHWNVGGVEYCHIQLVLLCCLFGFSQSRWPRRASC
ncbi:MAG: hypothetical protein K1X79_08495 [Oligoflexia bacterium]|nr:hypothetical protein [Oligoflexia bacterium]